MIQSAELYFNRSPRLGQALAVRDWGPRDVNASFQAGPGFFNDQIIADENSVFDKIGKIGDAAQAVGYIAAPLNPAVGGVLILGGKIASNASTVIEVGTGVADYLKNGNTGHLANSAGGAIGGVIAGQYGKKLERKYSATNR